jgi:lipopolysaccharide/colanic/teichoic acid biosynthesis glycosyltransferase
MAKRTFAVAFSATTIAYSLGLFVGVAAVTRLTSPGPFLFRHERIGHQGHRFQCLKFRTKKVGANAVLTAHSDTNSEGAQGIRAHEEAAQ